MLSISTVFPAGWKPDRCALWTTGSGSFRSEYQYLKCNESYFGYSFVALDSENLWIFLEMNICIDSTSCFFQIRTLAVLLLTFFLGCDQHLPYCSLSPPACKPSCYFTPTSLFWYVVSTQINLNVVTKQWNIFFFLVEIVGVSDGSVFRFVKQECQPLKITSLWLCAKTHSRLG